MDSECKYCKNIALPINIIQRCTHIFDRYGLLYDSLYMIQLENQYKIDPSNGLHRIGVSCKIAYYKCTEIDKLEEINKIELTKKRIH